jgi:sec-independent protein translocase protein TatA
MTGEKSMNFGPTELIIILIIVVVLFGVGRISKIAGEMGTGIRAFKEGLRGDEDENPVSEEPKEKTEES